MSRRSVPVASAASRPALADSPEVASYLKVTVRTLDQWAWKGLGPKFAKVGRHRRYKWSDVDKWLEDQARAAAA